MKTQEALQSMAGGTPQQITIVLGVIRRLVHSDKPELKRWGVGLAWRFALVYRPVDLPSFMEWVARGMEW